MPDVPSPSPDLLIIQDLTLRVEEAQDALSAIRNGQVDALVVRMGEQQEVLLLKGADQAYQVLFETLNEGAMTIAANGTILYANQRFAELIARPLEEVLGAPLRGFVAPCDTEAFTSFLQGVKHGGSKGEVALVRNDGSKIPVMISMRTIEESEDSTYTAVVTDLSPIKEAQAALQAAHDRLANVIGALRTEIAERGRLEAELRQQAQKLVEADRRKDEFLAMLAHELRNPLAPLRNAAELLRVEARGQPCLERHRQIIERQTQHLSRLVDDLLDVSRITRGVITLERQVTNLNELIRAAVESATPLLNERGHTVSVTLPDEPVWLEVDPTRLEQVLVNLLNNAAKYTLRGGHIEVAVEPRGEVASVRVRDDGLGIEPELLPHVFELFVQGKRSLDRAQGGLGIGLTLVKSLVEMHGGMIRAQSEGMNRGSEFVVELPVMDREEVEREARALSAPRPQEAEEAARPRADSVHPRTQRVLVVEDNVDAAEMLGELLRLWGYEVCTAFDGEEALRAASSFQPDAVLMDVGLPGMDGYEVARRMRRSQPPRASAEGAGDTEGADGEAKEPLMVAVTGYSQERDRELARESGFDCYLVKPPDPESLRKILECGASAAERL